MKRWVWASAILAAGLAGITNAEQDKRPFEGRSESAANNKIDELVLPVLKLHGLTPAAPCSDEVFVRRAFLDVIGTLPRPDEVNDFLKDSFPNKREKLIDTLFERDEFADYWAVKWCDILRVKAEFPINLWPNAVQAYHHWVRDALRRDMPYDEFARALLTSSGSNFRVPPVNFYRAVQGRTPETLAEAAALTFMGARFSKWPEDHQKGMAAFFSRVAFKSTGEWKEEIVQMDPAANGPLDAAFPDGTIVKIEAGKDPREVFTDWLISPNNPWFAKNIVNRIWSWLLGMGLINEADDIRDDNPAVHPEVLAYLEKELVASNYNLRAIYKLILTSGVYQQSSIPRMQSIDAETYFACYPTRRLDAEVLIDALCAIFGKDESYSSPVPEPFTYIPEGERTIDLADGSITSAFLEMFGRPTRDTGLESERNNQSTDDQRLHMLNSSHIQKKIEQSPRMRELLKIAKGNRRLAIRTIYMNVLSRPPTDDEVATIISYAKEAKLNPQQAANDIAWSLINTKEFLFRH
jgi:hypothetical protein